jgi:hypothetical protein
MGRESRVSKHRFWKGPQRMFFGTALELKEEDKLQQRMEKIGLVTLEKEPPTIQLIGGEGD